MNLVTTLYVAAIGAGVIWVVFRVIVYLRAERARDRRMSTDLILDDQFKDYLKELTAENESPRDPPPPDSDKEQGSLN